MFYGYVCNKPYELQTILDHNIPVYVITNWHETPEEAEREMATKIKEKKSTSAGHSWYIINCYGSSGIIKSKEPIKIPDGYWGVAV